MSLFNTAVQQSQTALEAEDAEQLWKGDAKEGIDRDSAWVKRVGWVRHFGQRDLQAIAEAAQWIRAKGEQGRQRRWEETMTEEAQREQKRIELLGRRFCHEVERCCFRLDSVPVRTRQLLQNIEPGKVAGVPFQRKATKGAMDKYLLVGQRFLMFCYRAYQLGREAAEEQWAVRWTEEQWGTFQDVAYELDKVEREGAALTSGGETSEDEDDEEVWTFSPRPRPAPVGDTSADRLGQACFRFLVACIRDRVGGDQYTNVLLCFCAAMGIRQHPAGFSEPVGYTGQLAAVLWWSRLFFLEDSFADEPPELETLPYEALARFDEAHARWLCSGTHSTVDVLLEWMAYGKGYRKQALGVATMRWSADRGVLFHNGEAIQVRDFQQTLYKLAQTAEQQLDELIEGQWQSIGGGLALHRIQDSMVRLGTGQSFATQAANAWLQPGPCKVLDVLCERLWDGRLGQWRRKAVRQWLRRLSQFRQNLMAITHAWGGQPGRGPEISTMRHCDSHQLQRNVYVYGGQVMLVTDRDKMKAIRDIGRKVARFLPEPGGRMLAAYIVWLLPTERLLGKVCGQRQPEPADLAYLWREGNRGPWSTSRLSAILGRVLKAGTGVEMGVQRYRQVVIEMGRQIKGIVLRQLEAEEGGESEDEGLTVDPVTGETVQPDGSWNVVWDLQATHSTQVARQHYGLHVGFLGTLQPEMIETYRSISRLWHQFLEQGASEGIVANQGRKRARADSSQAELAVREISRQRSEGRAALRGWRQEAAVELRRLLGEGATWKSAEQEACMGMVLGLRHGESGICVLPTGAGKSILFFLAAALAQTGSNVVVVPFVALMDDLVERARSLGVDCIRFLPGQAIRGRTTRAARLVVVSADVAAGEEFSSYADGLVGAGLLQRVFVDECHTVITEVGYRARLGTLRSMHRFGVAVVWLTATLPPVLEPWFRQSVLANDAVMVRGRTGKANCRYKVEVARPGEGLERARGVVEAMDSQMDGMQKGVVYCRSRRQSEGMAAALGCSAYHSGMAAERRREVLGAWVEGRGPEERGPEERRRWIVATTGLGTGIDIGGIVRVVHAGRPFGLVDLVQQTGRGGRQAGEVVQSVVVVETADVAEGGAAGREHKGVVEQANEEAIGAFLRTRGCRRTVLGAFLDGVEGVRCETVQGAVRCDRCEQRGEEAVEEAVEEDRWIMQQKEEGRAEAWLWEWLAEAEEDWCDLCTVKAAYEQGAEAKGVQHGPGTECPCGAVSAEVWAGVERMYQELGFDELSCCYRCRLPLDWCLARSGGGEGGCMEEDHVTDLCVLPLLEPWARRVAERVSRQRVVVDEVEEYIKWLGQGHVFYGKRGTNLLRLWEGLLQEAYWTL